MSSSRYLELDSEYRNRNQGEVGGLSSSPANFIVEISQKGQNTINQAVDPVSDAAPKLAWNSSFQANSGATSVTLDTTPISYSTVSGPEKFTIIADGENKFRHPEDYYTGAILALTASDGVDTSVHYRRITSYELIDTPSGGNDRAIITVNKPLPDLSLGVTYTAGSIGLPTNDTSSADVPQLFIPTAPEINNFYAGCLVHNLNTGEYRTITAFDAKTRIATLDANTGVSWSNGDFNFVIVKERASSSGDITVSDGTNTIGGISADREAVQLSSSASNISDIYNGSYLRLGKPQTVDGDQPLATSGAPFGEQKIIIDYTALDGTFTAHGGTGTNTFTLNTTSNENITGLLLTDSTTNETREVATYDISTKVGTTTQNWASGSNGDVFFVRTAELASSFSVATPAPGSGNTPGTYEIEQVSRDNMVPLNYIGSKVSSAQMVCYELELIHLILPNSVLTQGGRIAFYPYVYVLLDNISSASGRADGLIYSNNPNARKMMFKAVIDDTPTPLISAFIKIDGDGMVQTVKFNPYDSFRLAIFLPDGTLFETVETDTLSPNPPNKLVQISALFAMRKL